MPGPQSREPLSPAFSLYLDAIRTIAALIVFLEHAKPDGLFTESRLVPDLSGEAVIAFFVLSGFIIATTTDVRRGWRHFAMLRAARIYSVALPALLFGIALKASTALIYNHALFAELRDFDLTPWRILANLSFLGEVWTLHVPLPWNGAVWSLHYEVIYYILFAVFAFTAGRRRALGVALICLLAGPKIILLLPCWWIGVWIAQNRTLAFPSRAIAWTALIGAPIVVLALNCTGFSDDLRTALRTDVPGFWRLYDAQRFVTWTIDAALFAGMMIAARQLDAGTSLMAAARTIRWAAGYSFSLYLFHRPLQNFLAQMHPGRIGATMAAALIAAMLAVVVALGSITERKKHLWQRWMSALLGIRAEHYRRPWPLHHDAYPRLATNETNVTSTITR